MEHALKLSPTGSQKDNGALFFLATVCVLIVRLRHPLYFIPDSYEIATIADCLWSGGSLWVDCEEVATHFRPIAPSILIGFLLPFFQSITALTILCTLSITLFFYALGQLLKSHLPIQLVALVLIGASLAPTINNLLGLVDARILILGPTFWLYHRLQNGQLASRYCFFMGFVAALISLSRPEQLLLLFLILPWLRSASLRAKALLILGMMIPMLAWVGFLSFQSQQLMFMPRHWEGWLLEQEGEIPRRWLQQLYGMGVWSPPLREFAMTHPPPTETTMGPSIVQAIFWIRTVITDAFSPLYLSVIALGLGIGLSIKKARSTFLILLSISVPSLAAAVYPQAQDGLFSQANLIPFILSIVISALVGAAIFIHQKQLSVWRSNALLSAFLFVLFASDYTDIRLPQIEKSDAGKSFIAHYQQEEKHTFLASFETAQLLYHSKQRWQQLPSPFERRDDADFLIYSHLDTQLWLPTPQIRGKKATLVKHIEGDASWVLVYQLSDTGEDLDK
jgi:hypothetical protein